MKTALVFALYLKENVPFGRFDEAYGRVRLIETAFGFNFQRVGFDYFCGGKKRSLDRTVNAKTLEKAREVDFSSVDAFIFYREDETELSYISCGGGATLALIIDYDLIKNIPADELTAKIKNTAAELSGENLSVYSAVAMPMKASQRPSFYVHGIGFPNMPKDDWCKTQVYSPQDFSNKLRELEWLTIVNKSMLTDEISAELLACNLQLRVESISDSLVSLELPISPGMYLTDKKTREELKRPLRDVLEKHGLIMYTNEHENVDGSYCEVNVR